jgi:hypothetical protein
VLLQQLQYAIRALARARGFTVAAVLSLALGIGGSVAIFSLLNVIALKPLPYADPDRLVLVNEILPKSLGSATVNPIQGGHILRWRTEIKSFASVAGAIGTSTNLMQGKEPVSLPTLRITADLFDVLGEKPQLGRWFRRSEEQTGQPNVAILSNSLWHRRFTGDPRIVGRKVLLDKKPYEVVGVAAAGMRFYKGQLDAELPENPEIFIPLRLAPWEVDLNTVGSLSWCVAIARLRPGVSVDQSHAELETYMAGFSRRNQEHRGSLLGSALAEGSRRRHADRLDVAHGRCRFRSVDRMRKHSESAAGAGGKNRA